MFEFLVSAYVIGVIFSAVIGLMILLNLKRGFSESLLYSFCVATFWPVAIPLIIHQTKVIEA
jgi:hypothetical protein